MLQPDGPEGADLAAHFLIDVMLGRAISCPMETRLPDGQVVPIEIVRDDGTIQTERLVFPELTNQQWAAQQLMDRAHGKCPDKIEVTGAGGKDLIDPASLSAEALEHGAQFTALIARDLQQRSETELPVSSGEDAPEVH